MKTALITTTIRVPRNIEGYFANAAAHGHRDIEAIVIGDHKTPAETGAFLAELTDETGYATHWWDVERQKTWLRDLPELDRLIPWNSVGRRNLAYVLAVEAGAECIITVDDDNFVADGDYFGGHGIVGRTETLPVVSSSNGWFNSSSLLATDPTRPLFHRGFPTTKRAPEPTLEHSRATGRVVSNAGLWLGVADADAMSHLDAPTDVTGFKDPTFDGGLGVAHGTMTVINTQNTAFHRDLLPAMYLDPLFVKCGPLTVGRYDDIWMGIFLKVLTDHLGDYITVGLPWVRQIRNDHDLIQDMLWELPAQRITNTLAGTLERVQLTGTDYGTCYMELVRELRRLVPEDAYSDDEKDFLDELLGRMEAWARVARGFLAAVD